jgi:hypothetical protein
LSSLAVQGNVAASTQNQALRSPVLSRIRQWWHGESKGLSLTVPPAVPLRAGKVSQ